MLSSRSTVYREPLYRCPLTEVSAIELPRLGIPAGVPASPAIVAETLAEAVTLQVHIRLCRLLGICMTVTLVPDLDHLTDRVKIT